MFNRCEAACFLSEFTSIFVLGAVCLVGSDFIDTKSKKKDENIVLQKFKAENTGRGILLLELKHQPKPTQSMPTFDEQ